MLLEAIGDFLPLAVGAALSPIPIAAVVTILLSARPANASAFLLGWVVGILVVGIAVLLTPGLCTERGEPTVLSGWVRLLLGAGLLILAGWKWWRRPSADDPVEVPRVLSSMDSNTAGRSVIVGISLSAINPKNLALTFAAAVAIDGSVASPARQAVALAIYAGLASLSIIVPILAHSLFTERVQEGLADFKEWLIRNNVGVVVVLLIVFGTLLIGNGVKILAA